ncbi:UsfY protein [Mycolicibacterium canariasense]|uniref:UsfY protein n=1 Tax=Mycolicibacterium canariasense TaxID=228230 RepID=A0A100WB93_MYCCR|nr:protein UsfY [Mycolicibacterium canariasense]MCV7209210.1 UsfY protein [Mycolicibacterium canariasense]ORV05947.1 UsfY protein [Mycolicibacterium canariasense]GAS95264.1 UsfY protein [Mycolicibacterium canariasense]
MRSPQDPLDHARTTRPHAGESMKDNKNFPALVLLGVALVAFVGCLAAFATAHTGTGTVLAAIAAVVFVVSMSWFAVEHRRVRRMEDARQPDSSS